MMAIEGLMKTKFRVGQVVCIEDGIYRFYRQIYRVDDVEPGVWLTNPPESFPYRRDQLRPLTARECGKRK